MIGVLYLFKFSSCPDGSHELACADLEGICKGNTIMIYEKLFYVMMTEPIYKIIENMYKCTCPQTNLY